MTGLTSQLLMVVAAIFLALVVVFAPGLGYMLLLAIGGIVVVFGWRRVAVRALNEMCRHGPNGPDVFN
jgi:hypothetical protein